MDEGCYKRESYSRLYLYKGKEEKTKENDFCDTSTRHPEPLKFVSLIDVSLIAAILILT